MSFYNEEYFPTPVPVIEKMLEPWRIEHETKTYYRIGDKTILEPSAGHGAILDYIGKTDGEQWERRRAHVDMKRLYAIEKDPEMRHILQQKGYKLIEDNFLEYHGHTRFDLILMNPPFSNGDEHLLKAWDIMDAGDIVCLLNAETIRNQFSAKRRALGAIIEQFGSVEYIGNAFEHSDRKTGVEVVLVRLTKVAQKSRFDFDFGSSSTHEVGFTDEVLNTLPGKREGQIEIMVRGFEESVKAYFEYMKAREKLRMFTKSIRGASSVESMIETVSRQAQTPQEEFNNFVDELKRKAWDTTFRVTKIQDLMTSKVEGKFEEFSKANGVTDYNAKNISNIFDMLIQNREALLEESLETVFDTFTKYYSENRMIQEGWKTNDAWMVNRKVILPHFVTGDRMFSGKYDTNYYKNKEYRDIDKAMCYLTGKTLRKVDDVPGIESLEDAIKKIPYGDSSLHESEFFQIRAYKKGTLHLIFKDEWLWMEFNIRATKMKNWLPGTMKNKYKRKKETV